MLINREWKHSFESYPGNSVTSLVSVWDLMFDEDGNSWFWAYSKDSTAEDGTPMSPSRGCHLEHDLICFNKKLYDSDFASTAKSNINSNVIPEDSAGVKIDSDFESDSKYLYGTFGIDISLPFYSPSSRPEKVTYSNLTTLPNNFNPNNYFYKYDKNAVIPYGNLRTFTINSISIGNSFGGHPKINGYTEPMYFANYIPPIIGIYDEKETAQSLYNKGADIWLKGKNTEFTEENDIDENLEAYNNICVDPLSNYGQMLIIRAISTDATIFNLGQSDKKTDFAKFFNAGTDFNEIKDLLKASYVWVRAPFFADYIKPNSYNQDLNKNSKVVHRDLILSEKGDFNEYNESIVATETITDDEDEPTKVYDTNHNWIDTLPYISRTAPALDFIKPESLNELPKNDYWFNEYDIAGIPIPSSMSRLGVSEQSYEDNEFCPFIYWNTEFTEEYVYDNKAPTYFESFYKGRMPVFTKKYGNIYADGRIFSPTIDELWTAYKELVCGRDDSSNATNNDDISIPLAATSAKVLNKNHRISYSNGNHSWSFDCDDIAKEGDPLNFILGSYNESDGSYIPTKVSDFINHNDSITYNIFSSIQKLNNTLRSVMINSSTPANKKEVDFATRKSFFYLGKPYDEKPTVTTGEYKTNNVTYNEKPSNNDNEKLRKYMFGPRPNPYSLRELEALVKGNRYNVDTLAIWLRKNVTINSKVTYRYNSSATDSSYSNEAKSGLYQFHKNYNGEFSDNTQYEQNKSSGGYLDFDDNSKFATHFTLRSKFARNNISKQQNKVSSSQVFLAADGTWRCLYEKPRTQIVSTTR